LRQLKQLTDTILSPNAEKRRVEHATGLVGLLTLVSELGREVVPPPELVSVLPALRERRNGAAVHEAGDALQVGLVGGGVRHILELLPVGHLGLHEPGPPLRVGDDAATVAVLVLVLELLPGLLVGQFHGGGVRELGLDRVTLGRGFRLVLLLPLLPLALVLGLDLGVARLLRVREDGVRVRADVLLDVAAERARPVAADEVGVGVAVDADHHAVELELDRPVLLRRERDGLGDGGVDGASAHDAECSVLFFPQVLHGIISFLGFCRKSPAAVRVTPLISSSLLSNELIGMNRLPVRAVLCLICERTLVNLEILPLFFQSRIHLIDN